MSLMIVSTSSPPCSPGIFINYKCIPFPSASWLLSCGLPRSSFTVLPFIDPSEMSRQLASSHVGIFANRAEGGTNLVAMEALATG